jgi:predicted small lipoprotein YifL
MKNIFIALLLTVVLFCFSACTKQNEEPTDLPTDATTDASTTEELDGYDAIIKRYAELLKTKKESGELPPLDDGADEIEKEI